MKNRKIIIGTRGSKLAVIYAEKAKEKILNHSNDFWKTVEKYMANYKLQKKWLKTNSSKLIF